EDVCLHCSLCAERCPTGAWDMQKFRLDVTHAGPRCRNAAVDRPAPAADQPQLTATAA
ncbi:MAG TPA: 4Fe-4S binding protein, partial [Accumulibacter sp.]|nr:4Fe-4S binding protein [Accumulibacter sp.]